jgi:peptidoglycan/xylan/chitin deacetylase (PgdA/CDA1 family)
MDHQLASVLSMVQFRQEVTASKSILEHITGKSVEGYRAPAWSWPREPHQSAHWYEVLRDVGYRYSSSVIPAAVIGTARGPSVPYKANCGIWEFPLPICGIPLVRKNLERFAKDGCYRKPRHTWRGGVGLPYSGGLFLRCLGRRLAGVILSHHMKKRGYAMLYMHPGEISSHDASWVTGLDRRYLNLWQRWRVGFQSHRSKAAFSSFVATHSGCSVIEFLRAVAGVTIPGYRTHIGAEASSLKNRAG